MANRHTHRKLRADVRARMAATGESHQTALNRILAARGRRERSTPEPLPDLIPAKYFGLDVTLAVFDVLSHARVIVVSGSGGLLGLPLGDASLLHVETGCVQ